MFYALDSVVRCQASTECTGLHQSVASGAYPLHESERLDLALNLLVSRCLLVFTELWDLQAADVCARLKARWSI